jgi:hydroxymethylbilane synthase
MWQAEWVRDRIHERLPSVACELVRIQTTGDRIQDVALAKVGGKGLFVKEIEEALLDGRIDVAVHSMKDVPARLAPGLHIAAITVREDPRDVLISERWRRLADLPPGARVGTSSLRRQSQLLHFRPDLKVEMLRGNLDTRLRKLTSDGLDAVIVAAAGVIRLEEQRRISEYLEPEVCLPAVGQGTLGLECRTDDVEVNEIVKTLEDRDVSRAVRAERAFLERLEGGCQVPIAAYGQLVNGGLRLRGLVAAIDGREVIKEELHGDSDEPERLGRSLAERILTTGGRAILERVAAAGIDSDQARGKEIR